MSGAGNPEGSPYGRGSGAGNPEGSPYGRGSGAGNPEGSPYGRASGAGVSGKPIGLAGLKTLCATPTKAASSQSPAGVTAPSRLRAESREPKAESREPLAGPYRVASISFTPRNAPIWDRESSWMCSMERRASSVRNPNSSPSALSSRSSFAWYVRKLS